MTDLITGSPNTFSNPSSSAPVATSTGNGWSEGTIIQVVLLIIVLALLGLNVFAYLAKGTDYLSHIIQLITGNIPEKAQDILATSGKGVELGADVVGVLFKMPVQY